MKLEQTTQVQPEVALEPRLKKALQLKLQSYAAVAAEIKALKLRKDKLTEELAALRDESEQLSVSIEGYGTVTYVGGLTYKKFNPKKFVSLGGNLAVYNDAVEEQPKKAFDKITVAGVEDGGDDE